MIRIVLPPPLQILAQCEAEVTLDIGMPVTQRKLIDALETRYPMLAGTLRDPVTLERRPLVRFFAGRQDMTHQDSDESLPEAVASGAEAVIVVLAIAGG